MGFFREIKVLVAAANIFGQKLPKTAIVGG